MQYKTKQRAQLLEYLEAHPDETFSAEEILNAPELSSISKSAVYRNLSALEEEEKIRRVSVPGSQKTYYRFVNRDECRAHLHLSCSSCGKTFHLDAKKTNFFINSVMIDSRFQIDRTATVLYGICADCQNPYPVMSVKGGS